MGQAAAVRSVSPRRTRRVAAWLEQHGWALAAATGRLWRRPWSSLLTVLVMGIALALPLLLWVLLGSAQQLAQVLGPTQGISAFLQPDVDASAANTLAAQLRDRADVAAVKLVSPAQGLVELQHQPGFAQAVSALGHNPLPYVVVLTPRGDAAGLAAVVRALPQVATVDDAHEWRARARAWLGAGHRIAVVLSLVLGLAALLVVGNGIRLDIHSRRAEIDVLTLIGARPAFVRRAYLYAGCWYGLASGIVACVLAWVAGGLISAAVEGVAESYGGTGVAVGLDSAQCVWVLVIAVALGWVGARVVSAWMLRRAA